MMRLCLMLCATLTLSACSSAIVANPLSAYEGSERDRQEVQAAVQRLFDAMRQKDTAAMRQLFEPNARLVGMRPTRTGEERMQVLSWSEFAAFAAKDSTREWVERVTAPEIRIRGSLATVWAFYHFSFGQTPSHCGVDAVQLLRSRGQWRIVAIADTYELANCPASKP